MAYSIAFMHVTFWAFFPYVQTEEIGKKNEPKLKVAVRKKMQTHPNKAWLQYKNIF